MPGCDPDQDGRGKARGVVLRLRHSPMRNCTSGNLEIPGSMLASPRNDGWKLRPQDRSTCRRAALEIDMRLGDILQRVGVVDRHVQLAVDDGSKQRVAA